MPFSFPLSKLRGSRLVSFSSIRWPYLPASVVLLAAIGCGGHSTSQVVDPAPQLAVTTLALPDGMLGSPYSATLTSTGGTAPYTWSLTSGTLPAGLALNASTGAIAGTPTASANAAPLTFTVVDSGSPVQTKAVSLTLTIAASGPALLNITTTSLPNGQVGTPYSTTLAATGGTAPYTWSLTSGTLPAGLALNASTGAIAGTPTATANATALTFNVVDSSSPVQTNAVNLTLTIAASGPAILNITTTSLPNGQVGTPYSATLAATGGTAPYSWSLTSGTLPAGLTLNGATGAIAGTPTATANAVALTFKVTDSSSPVQTNTMNLALTIAASGPAPLNVTTASLPNGQVGIPYSATLTATGGTTPYSWSLTSGTLPAGLTLNGATGAIAGTPTATANAVALTFKVTDSSSPVQTNTMNLALTIAASGPAPLNITTASLPNGQVGIPYSATLAATGGATPYTWSLTSGTLAAGLTLNGATGAIAGTPTATANAGALTFKVTDSSSPVQTNTVNLPLTVSPSSITVSISPKRAALTVAQALSVVSTTNDLAGINWSVTGSACNGNACGTFSSAHALSGAAVTYTAPSAAGTYTIAATSATDGTVSASVGIAVTDLSGVTTYHNNTARNGANTQEYALSPSTVTTSTFGKLFSCTVDGAVYAQPLWVPNLTIASAKHNVVVVATQNDGLFAFDADTNTTPCTPLWHANLIDSAHGGNSGESSVPSSGTGALVGSGNGDIAPEVGVTGTPVIDLVTNTLYVVSKSVIASGPSFYQRLHAIDL